MTQEEKQLLLKDLSGRLPYRVNVNIEGYYDHILEGIHRDTLITDRGINYPIRLTKPYLRSMPSMTKEEIEEYFRQRRHDTIDVVNPQHWCNNSICAVVDGLYMRYWYEDLVVLNTLDWLNQHMFDYRNLIGKGLAIEAPEGMYNTK